MPRAIFLIYVLVPKLHLSQEETGKATHSTREIRIGEKQILISQRVCEAECVIVSRLSSILAVFLRKVKLVSG